jgi:hypothetical protein
MRQYTHFLSLLEIMEMKPPKDTKPFSELVDFLSHVFLHL